MSEKMNAEKARLLKAEQPTLLLKSECCECGTPIPMEPIPAYCTLVFTKRDGKRTSADGAEWCPKCKKIHLVEFAHRNDLELWEVAR